MSYAKSLDIFTDSCQLFLYEMGTNKIAWKKSEVDIYLKVIFVYRLIFVISSMGLLARKQWGTFHVDGLVQDCSISIANALEMLQSCPKPSMYDPIFQVFQANAILDWDTVYRWLSARLQ